MSRKISALVAIAALVMAVSLFAAPLISHAGTIDCIGVSNGIAGGSFIGGGASTCGTGTTTWTFTSIVLAPNTAAIFTQNQAAAPSTLPTGLPGFNFDTSDKHGATQPNYTITINGVAIPDANILNFGGIDSADSTVINEATNWVKIASAIPDGHGGLFDVYTGYADTLHSGDCHDGGGAAAQPSQFCLPYSGAGILNTWDGSGTSTAAAAFLGHGSNLPGYPASPHCNVNEAPANTAAFNCYDAGAIMVVELPRVVPEPSSLFLLGVGLMGVAFYGRRRLNKNS